jgi:hypothetical protein
MTNTTNDLVTICCDTTVQAGFRRPVTFTPRVWRELVHVEGDMDATDARLFDLMFAARCAVRAAARAESYPQPVTLVEYDCRIGDGRERVSCHLVAQERDGWVNLTFRLPDEN